MTSPESGKIVPRIRKVPGLSSGYFLTYRIWLMFPVFGACFIAASLMVYTAGAMPSRSDYWMSQQELFIHINHFLGYVPDLFWENITCLGDLAVLIGLVSPLLLFYPRAWAAIFTSIPAGVLFSTPLKHLLSIPRPAMVVDPGLFHIVGGTVTGYNSFPSGHTITVFAVAAAVLASVSGRFGRGRYWCYTPVLVLAVLVAISRVAVGAHWPLDVVAGAVLGWLAGLSGAVIAHRYRFRLRAFTDTSNPKTKLGLILLLTLLSGALLLRQAVAGLWVFDLAAAAGLAVAMTMILSMIKQNTAVAS